MSSYDDHVREAAQILAGLRQEYADNEQDHDRNPTEDGFVEWLARRATKTRPTPHLDAVKAERDAALARADSHRQAAHEAAGQLNELRRRIVAAHDALTRITEADDDAFTTLESTVEYVVSSYRAIATAESQAADEVVRLRADLDAIGGMRVIEHEGIRLRVITRALHDRLCRARVATPQEEIDPDILHCAFCGFCYPRERPRGADQG